MNSDENLRELLLRLMALAPAGFAAALHIDFITPRYLFQTYDRAWKNYYSVKGLVLKDPAVKWGFRNDGVATWPELAALDTEGVFATAADHGLNHWAVVATSRSNLKSIGAFSRKTEAFSAAETDEISYLFECLDELTRRGIDMDPEFDQMLTALSVNLTHHSPRN